MTIDTSKLPFPELPTYKGLWRAIYVTPVIGSHERIALAVVALGDDGEHLTVNALSHSGYHKYFDGDQLEHVVQIATDSLCLFLATNKDMDSWKSPLSGVELGHPHEALGDDLLDIATQGLRFSSMFYGLEQRALNSK